MMKGDLFSRSVPVRTEVEKARAALEKEDKVRMSLDMPFDLHVEFKHLCALRRETMRDALLREVKNRLDTLSANLNPHVSEAAKTEGDMFRLSFDLEKSLHLKFKSLCIGRGISMRLLLLSLVLDDLDSGRA